MKSRGSALVLAVIILLVGGLMVSVIFTMVSNERKMGVIYGRQAMTVTSTESQTAWGEEWILVNSLDITHTKISSVANEDDLLTSTSTGLTGSNIGANTSVKVLDLNYSAPASYSSWLPPQYPPEEYTASGGSAALESTYAGTGATTKFFNFFYIIRSVASDDDPYLGIPIQRRIEKLVTYVGEE